MGKTRSKKPAPEFGRESDLNEVAEKYAVRVTPAVYETIESDSPADPVARQYIPDARELVTRPDELDDPTGDEAHSPVPGIVHRYPDRVLLMPVKSCAVYCRYCFRRESVGKEKNMLDGAELDAALAYIRSDENIWEVILSGGDPLVLSPRRLAQIMRALEAIDHVQIIRIHSRIPVADPLRVDEDLCAALQSEKAVYVAVHVNHAQELSADAQSALAKLRAAGCVLLSQSVLLRGVNDKAETLEMLFRRLVALKVKPYYLHHPDKAPGTGHFRVSIAQGQALMRALRGRLSGLCLPTYMLDIPGGHGKVPLTPCYLEAQEEGYIIEDPNGKKHSYTE